MSARIDVHGIAVLLGTSPGRPKHWPAEAAEGLRSLIRRGVLADKVMHPPVAALVEQLAEAGAPSIAMKGCALAYGYYSSPPMRPRGDTDLLIHERDLDLARRLLARASWHRPTNPHGIYFQEIWRRDCGVSMVQSLDLHWRPTDRPAIQDLLRTKEFWAHAEPLPGLSPHALAPAPLQLLLHAAINQTWHERHGFFANGERYNQVRRLIWAVDCQHITARFAASDWDMLADLCAARGAGPVVRKVLAGAAEDIGLPLPDGILDRLASGSRPTALEHYLYNADLQQMWRDDFRATRGLAARLRLVRLSATATREQLLEKYPGADGWPTMLLRIRWIAAAAARVVFGRSPAKG
ncbi:nucleotidyltransferase family protein [Porphyrobacter sp. AAP82]|uniref:nucleotidyltransferase family protein n=1 Tax=Porphyrobacter sp. AAP82 TaxID=1248917 RepID=UPI0005272152|nr:nucleotidyltransferase family protein [Porphyrobacter sp. AAP82]